MFKKTKIKKWIAVLGIVILTLTMLLSVFGVGVYAYLNKSIDFRIDEAMFEVATGEPIILYAKRGFGDSEREVEIRTSAYSEQSKFRYSISEISPYLIKGFIAVEDREFYNHGGVNIKRTLKAALNYIFGSNGRFGASTITQQVIKNISGDNDQTLKRKASEIIRAIHIEKNHTKDEILETYLNIVPMTDNMAGVGIAADAYFGKLPLELNIEECATIIAITNAPARYNPYTHYEACVSKRNNVLYAMRECGVINSTEYENAIEKPIALRPKPDKSEYSDTWLTETVIADIEADLVKELHITNEAARILIASGGLTAKITGNLDLQELLEGYFENENNFPEEVKNGLNYSMVINNSQNGDLLAIVGSVGKKRGNRLYNFATTPVTPASTLKPLALYAPLIDEGRIMWSTVFDDVPVSFYESGTEWHEYPHNSPNVYDGLVTTAYALAKSKNTVAVRLYNMLGKERIYSILSNNYGFDTLLRSGYNSKGDKITDLALSPLALGQLCYGVPLRKLTEAYTVFPNDGIKPQGRSYTEVYSRDGEILLSKAQKSERVYSSETARIMNKLLQGVVDYGTARSITLKYTVDTAGKTGTSGNDKDKLFVGYTPYFTAGIWCGMKNGSSLSGISVKHLQVWDAVMNRAHELVIGNDEAPLSFSTSGLVEMSYCKDSGKLISDNCLYDVRGEREELGYFSPSNLPSEECDRHVKVLYNFADYPYIDELYGINSSLYISLIKLPERSFPKEIYVADAKYGCQRDFKEVDTNRYVPCISYPVWYERDGKRRKYKA